METQNKKSYVPLMIIGTFVGFGLFIGYMVYQAFQQDVNLVRKDYYQETLRQNEHQAEVLRTAETDIELFYNRNKGLVQLELPSSFNGDVKGEILFYRPSDASLDFKVNLKEGVAIQQFSTEAIKEGKWELKAQISHGGNAYYKESFFIK